MTSYWGPKGLWLEPKGLVLDSMPPNPGSGEEGRIPIHSLSWIIQIHNFYGKTPLSLWHWALIRSWVGCSIAPTCGPHYFYKSHLPMQYYNNSRTSHCNHCLFFHPPYKAKQSKFDVGCIKRVGGGGKLKEQDKS